MTTLETVLVAIGGTGGLAAIAREMWKGAQWWAKRSAARADLVANAKIESDKAHDALEAKKLDIESAREERTEEKLWDRLEIVEEKLEERDETIKALHEEQKTQRSELDQCKKDHQACEERSDGQDESISALQEQAKRQDTTIAELSDELFKYRRTMKLEVKKEVRAEVQKLSDPVGIPAQTGPEPIEPDKKKP